MFSRTDYLDSHLNVEQVLDFGFEHVCVATGASWRRDATGRSSAVALVGYEHENVKTADNIIDGQSIHGPVIVYDDDNFYMGGLITELLSDQGHAVTLVTSAGVVSSATEVTLEQHRTQTRVLTKGITVVVSHNVCAFDGETALLTCLFSGRTRRLPAATLIPVTSREPHEHNSISTYWMRLRREARSSRVSLELETVWHLVPSPSRCLPVIVMHAP